MLLDHTAMHVRNPDSIAAVLTLVLYYKQAFELPQYTIESREVVTK